MAKPPEQRAAKQPTPSDLQAVEVLDLFLGWCEKNRAASTYTAQRYYSKKLAPTIAGLLVVELKPYHLTRVMDGEAGWASNTKHNFVTAINRAMNWAEKQGLIEKNPVRHTEKPAREARELAATPADIPTILASVTEPNFRDLIRFAGRAAPAPQEIRAIEARHVDFDNKRIVFPPKESKGKKKHRVVYLTEAGADILRPLAVARPTGTLFRNSQGRAWTKDSINCAFCRLQEKLGTKFHMGAFRKGYATEGLKAGVDTITMSHLLGHSSPVMLSKVYAKVQQDPVFMAEAARRAKVVIKGDGV